MTAKLLLASCICLPLLLACNRPVYEREVKEIDSLILALDSAKSLLHQIDTGGFDTLSLRFASNVNYVQQWYSQRGDTMTREMAMLMSEYRGMRKPYQQFMTKYAANEKELNFSQEQLQDLKHDISNNLLDSAIVMKLMESERTASTAAIQQAKYLNAHSKNTLELARYLEPRIDSAIAVLKSY